MGKKSAPAPNYAAAATAQGQANKESALQTAILSNPNVHTPYGSQTVTWGNQGQGRQSPPMAYGSGLFSGMDGGYSPGGMGGQYSSYPGGAGMPNTASFGGIPQATVNQTFSPIEQAKYDANSNLELGMLDTAQTGLSRVNEMMASPFETGGMQGVNPVNDTGQTASFDTSGVTSNLSGIDTASLPRANGYNLEGIGPYGSIGPLSPQGRLSNEGMQSMTGVNPGALPQVNQFGQSMDVARANVGNVNQTGTLNTQGMTEMQSLSNQGLQGMQWLNSQGLPDLQSLDTSRLQDFRDVSEQGMRGYAPVDTGGLTGVDTVDPSGLRGYTVDPSVGGLDQVAQAIRARGDEDFSRKRQALEADLIARGIQPGTDAYNARMQEIDRAQTDFNQQALLSAGQEQSRIAGLEMARRGQGLSEQQARFASQSGLRGQEFGERQGIASDAANQRGQQFGERVTLSGIASQRRGQEFGEQQALAQNEASNRGQYFGERAAVSQDAMQGRGQQFGERQAMVNDAAARRSQEFGERSGVAQFNEGQRSSRVGEQLAQQEADMAYNNMNFQQQQQVSQFQQSLRAQGLNEQTAQAATNAAIRSQQFGEQERMAAFQQSLRAQGLSEQQVQAEFQNAARQGTIQERSQMAAFEMALRQQGLSEQQVQSAINASNRSQQFGEAGARAGFQQSEAQRGYQNDLALQQAQQAERQRQIQEQAYLRQLPMNEINALRTGSQAMLPQFQGYQGAQVGAAPLFDAAVAQGNYDLASAQNRTGLGDVVGGLFGAAGAAGGFGSLFNFAKPGAR